MSFHTGLSRHFTEFDQEGSCNYAFTLLLRKADPAFCERVMTTLRGANVEYRRGMSGGGSQLRQPFLKNVIPADELI